MLPIGLGKTPSLFKILKKHLLISVHTLNVQYRNLESTPIQFSIDTSCLIWYSVIENEAIRH